jgi:hypothetical protein
MGLLGRIVDRLTRPKVEDRGARLEAEGRLEEAYEAYISAGQLEHAVRVLLARAESEPDPRRRLALLQVAASRAPEGSPSSRDARRRAASLRLDLARSARATALTSELLDLARQLEQLEMMQEAAEAYGLAGDTDNQSRVLVASGSIEALEDLLEFQREDRSRRREREVAWKEIRDLDAIGKRIACLERCEQWLANHADDDAIVTFARGVESRVVRSGAVTLLLEGERLDLVVDHPLIIGRTDASIDLPSPALSRRHMQVRRAGDQVVVEDLGSRNGTWIAGARMDGPLPVGNGVDLKLGGQIPLRLEPWRDGVKLLLTGRVVVAPLGPLRVGGFSILRTESGVIQLCASDGPPVLNGLTAEAAIDLAYGDKVSATRNGPVVVEVVAS